MSEIGWEFWPIVIMGALAITALLALLSARKGFIEQDRKRDE